MIPSPVVGICMQARKMRSMAWRLRAPGYCHHMYSMVCSWLDGGRVGISNKPGSWPSPSTFGRTENEQIADPATLVFTTFAGGARSI